MATVDSAEHGQVDSSKTKTYDKKCIFCKIVNKEMDAELLHCDEELSCFRDIKPGAPHHYLVVPIKHFGNCTTLTKDHVSLVQQMVDLGKEILKRNNVTDLSDVRFGFHLPPFCSVTHLHLHVLAPASQMGFMSRLYYRLNSFWFIAYPKSEAVHNRAMQYFLGVHKFVPSLAIMGDMGWESNEADQVISQLSKAIDPLVG